MEKQCGNASVSSSAPRWAIYLLVVLAAVALYLTLIGGPAVHVFSISLIGRVVLWTVFLGAAKLWWDQAKWIRWQPKKAILYTLVFLPIAVAFLFFMCAPGR